MEVLPKLRMSSKSLLLLDKLGHEAYEYCQSLEVRIGVDVTQGLAIAEFSLCGIVSIYRSRIIRSDPASPASKDFVLDFADQ